MAAGGWRERSGAVDWLGRCPRRRNDGKQGRGTGEAGCGLLGGRRSRDGSSTLRGVGEKQGGVWLEWDPLKILWRKRGIFEK